MIKNLKSAYKRKEKRIKQLESEVRKLKEANKQKPSLGYLYAGILNDAYYRKMRQRIVAAQLYRNIAGQNRVLRNQNKMLREDIQSLICRIARLENN